MTGKILSPKTLISFSYLPLINLSSIQYPFLLYLLILLPSPSPHTPHTHPPSALPPQVTILQCYRKGGAGDYYYSIQSMIEYEQENNLLTSSDSQSGSRTLLRLHRGLGACCNDDDDDDIYFI